jgi:MoxR-like ATPase
MSQATTSAKARTARQRAPKVGPDDFLRIETFLTTNVLIERDQEMRTIIRASIAGVNAHMGGAGGLAKSLALREYARCIEGARFFEKALQPGTPPDAVIGPYDMEQYANTGKFERAVEHYLPGAHIGFIDELLRSSGLMKDALMPLLNSEERRAEGNGGMIDTPLRFIVTAANTWFEPDDPYTQAIEDRITILMHIVDLKAEDSFKELIRRDHARRQANRAGSLERETITLAQFDAAQVAAEAVEPSASFIDAVTKLRRDCTARGLRVSPRRWIELIRVCRANAWMAGRDELVPEDLLAVEGGLWRSEDEIPQARELLLEFRGKFERMAEDRRKEADPIFSKIEAIRAPVENTPAGENVEPDTLKQAIATTRQVEDLHARIEQNLAEAAKEKAAAEDLHALANEVTAVRRWLFENGMPTKYKP